MKLGEADMREGCRTAVYAIGQKIDVFMSPYILPSGLR